MSRILLVDDLPDRLNPIVKQLHADHYEIIQSNNAYSCIQLAQTETPDCIILPALLPQLDGFETCRRIKAEKDTRNIPIIIVCDIHDDSAVQRAIAAGANDVIGRPLSYSLLHLRLRSMLGFLNAINKRRESESLLKEAKSTERMATIGIMASGIAHEFNNLNAIILGNVELLMRKKDLNVQVSERIENIHDAVLRSKQATSSLLNFTRGDSSSSDIVNIQDVLHSTVTMARGSFVQNSIELRSDLPPDPILVRGNADELGQVFLNIIINAMHAMEGQDDKILTITIDTDLEEEEEACVSICDTGRGIPEEKIKTLFHPYSSSTDDGAHDAHTGNSIYSKFAGSVFGLSISEAIVENHCGNIRVESTIGVGSTFFIALPTCTSAHYYRSPLPIEEIDTNLKGKHILITDDEAHIRDLLSELFEDYGCKITTASNGEQALSKVKTTYFDAVILDWQMPILDGSGFLDKLMDLAPEKRAPVVVVSGWQSGNLLSDQQKKLAPVTVSKPFKSNDMIEAVKEVFKRSKRRPVTFT